MLETEPNYFHPANKCLESGQGQEDLSQEERRTLLTNPSNWRHMSLLCCFPQCSIKIQVVPIPYWKLCSCICYEVVTIHLFPKHFFVTQGILLTKRLKGLSNPPVLKDILLRKQPKLNQRIGRCIFYPREQRVRNTDNPKQRTF